MLFLKNGTWNPQNVCPLTTDQAVSLIFGAQNLRNTIYKGYHDILYINWVTPLVLNHH